MPKVWPTGDLWPCCYFGRGYEFGWTRKALLDVRTIGAVLRFSTIAIALCFTLGKATWNPAVHEWLPICWAMSKRIEE